MSREVNFKILVDLMSDVLGAEGSDLSASSNPDNVEGWDSIGHLNLISSIEEKFAIALQPEDPSEMITVDLILDIIDERLAEIRT